MSIYHPISSWVTGRINKTIPSTRESHLESSDVGAVERSWRFVASFGSSKLGRTLQMRRFPSGLMEVMWSNWVYSATTNIVTCRAGRLFYDGLASRKWAMFCWKWFQFHIPKSLLLEQRSKHALHRPTCPSRVLIVGERTSYFLSCIMVETSVRQASMPKHGNEVLLSGDILVGYWKIY